MENFAFYSSLNYSPLQDTIFAKKAGIWNVFHSKRLAVPALILITISVLCLVSLKSLGNKKFIEGNQAVLSATVKTSPTPTVTPTVEPWPTQSSFFATSTPSPSATNSPTQDSSPTNTPTPGPTNTPTPGPTNTPTPTLTPTATPSPTPTPSDTVPPVITSMGGPENGSTITTDNFCFPMTIEDNVSHYPNIWTQYQFDSNTWTDWSNDQNTAYNPCFQNVHGGEHIFRVHAKDEAGNSGDTLSRDFKVISIHNKK